MSSPSRSLCRLLGIDHPIIQAPMAGTSTPAMAAAVAEAGGLGSVAVGAVDAAKARTMIAATRDATKRGFAVNVFCHRPAVADPTREAAWLSRLAPIFAEHGAAPPETVSEIYRSFLADDDMLAMLVAERPAAVSLHFGLPDANRLSALRDAGIALLATATSLAEGRAAQDAGVDAIVAQGWEAGGHRGVFDPEAPDDGLSTFALTKVLLRNLTVPIVAAGGLMDGHDVAACLRVGAAGAQLGTAFVGCPESAADDAYRAALRSEASLHTVMTRAISGRPARCLSNKFTNSGLSAPTAEIPDYPRAYDAGKALAAAARANGETGYGAQWAGQGAPLARSLPAGDLVAAIVAEMDRPS